jgi:hypothetical protein
VPAGLAGGLCFGISILPFLHAWRALRPGLRRIILLANYF